MNISNKLTILRLILIIPIVAFLIIVNSFGWNIYFNIGAWLIIFLQMSAFVLFVIASVTDYFDGKIARERGEVTSFGKLFDPLADKLLVFSILITYVAYHKISLTLVLILLAREFYITSYRALYSSIGKGIISAGTLGKYKTFAQLIGIGIMLLFNTSYAYSTILMLPSLLLSIISAMDYVKSNPIDEEEE